MNRKFTIIAIILLTGLPLLNLQGATAPSLTADDLQLEAETQTLVARGTATFTHEDFTIIADVIRFSKTERQAIATGKVQVTLGELRLIGQKVIYDMKSKTFEAENFRTGSPPFFAAGEKLKGNRKEVILENTTVYFQEPDWSGPSLTASRIVLYPEDRVETAEVTLKLGPFGSFSLPKLNRPIGHLGLQVQSRLGHRGDLGGYVQTQPLLPVSDTTSIGGSLDLYSKRGLMIGPAYTMQSEDDTGNRLVSTLQSGWIKDQEDPGLDIFNNSIDSERYFLEFRHNQQFANGMDINASLNVWSDSEVTRDFRRQLFEQAEQPDNWLEVAYSSENFVVSAFLRPQTNDFFPSTQRLPELRFDYLPTPVAKTPLVHNFSISAARLERDDSIHNQSIWYFFGLNSYRYERYDAVYRISWPMSPASGVSVTPYLSGRFKKHEGSGWGEKQNIGEFGLDFSMTAYRTWEYQNKTWGVNGLRHISRPVIQYRYREADEGDFLINYFSEISQMGAYLPIIDLDSTRQLDLMGDSNTLRFGWENILQTRSGDFGSRDLLRLDFYQDLYFSAVDLDNPWRNKTRLGGFYTKLSSKPANWLQLEWFNRFEPEEKEILANTFRLKLTDNKFWQLSLATDYLDNIMGASYEQYRLEGVYRLNRRWDMYSEIRYDAQSGKFSRQAYGLRQRINNLWEIEYEVVLRSGVSREDDFGFNIGLSLLRF